MNKIILSILILSGLLSFSGCVSSQEQLLLKKQQKEKARLEKIAIQQGAKLEKQKAKALKIKMYKEAKQYLNSNNDNNLIWNLLEQNNDEYKQTAYETNSEYKQRITDLNNKIFNRKFLFDYQPGYVLYNPYKKILWLGFNATLKYHQGVGFFNFMMAGQAKMLYGIEYYLYITANSNTLKRHQIREVHAGKTTVTATIIKKNCSAAEAKNIQENWNVRFVVDIDVKKHLNLNRLLGARYLPIAKIKMIIVYNEDTNEIYKVLY